MSSPTIAIADRPGAPPASASADVAAWLRGRHVVVLNWRDADHPQAGGAEVYCHAVAERFAAGGAHVTLVTSRAPGQARRGERDGVRIVRGGGRLGVYPFALGWLRRHRAHVDAVVDFQNGIPFFSPLAARPATPVVAVLHHVHQEQFALHFPRPAAAVGRFLEGPASRRVYRRRPLVGVSPSTREEARRMLGLRGVMHVVPNGLDVAVRTRRSPRTALPSITCVGRLVPQKRLDLLLSAVSHIPAQTGLRVDVVGSGPDRERLEALAASLELGDRVTFHGHVPAEVRDRLLDHAWLTVNPSAREGWGLSVLEANARGVPALAFDVPGLRDAIRPGSTGWLIGPDEHLAVALERTLALLADPGVADAYATRAIAWAASFSWERTADHIARLLAVEDDARRRVDRDQRGASDLVTRVDLPADEGTRARLAGARRTDTWRFGEQWFCGLLYGADEADASQMLDRLDVASDAQVTVARSSDLLVMEEPDARRARGVA